MDAPAMQLLELLRNGDTLGRLALGNYERPDGTFLVAIEVYDLDGKMREAYTREANTPEERDQYVSEGRGLIEALAQRLAMDDVHLVKAGQA